MSAASSPLRYKIHFGSADSRRQKTAAGILIPEKAQESLNRGEVLAVGPGGEKDKVTLKAGDIVVLPSYGGAAVNLGNTKDDDLLMLLRESEILAKVVDA